MSNKEITITVAGVGNSGKTTLMRIIENALREHGITDITPVTLGDEPMPDDARIKEIIASGRLTPRGKIDVRRLSNELKSRLLDFFSDYGEPVEVFDESEPVEHSEWTGKCKGSPGLIHPVMDESLSFTM